MAAHQVPAQPVGQAQRLFQIDLGARQEAGGAAQGFGRHVHRETVGRSATTVRQTPLTAMLSPSATSEKSKPPPAMTMRASAPRASVFVNATNGFNNAGEHAERPTVGPGIVGV